MVDRDAFLADFSVDSGCGSSSPCSPALLYSICALGALMSHDQNINELADLFSASAEEAIADAPFGRASILTSQAMMLCAVFESGTGNVSKAWIYSGS